MAATPKPSATPKYTTEPLIFNQFSGGLSDSPKIGVKYSFQDAQGFDFRTDPSQVSSLPGMTREDNGVMKDLVLGEVMVGNGIIYAFGDAGYVYTRSVAGSWSVFTRFGSGAAGIDYFHETDSIYLTSYKTVNRIGQVVNGTSPTINPDYYGPSISLDNETANTGYNVNADQEGSTLTTGILVATSPLSEASTSTRYFQTDIEPLNQISVFVTKIGTGNWTLTLHDGINNVLAATTITHGNMVLGWNNFVFAGAPNGQVRVDPGPNARVYHFHVTSTVADGLVSSSTVNDLSSCDCRIWADRFVQTNNNWHPELRFGIYETFGNGNYLSIWQPLSDPPTNTEWQRHRLTFPASYEVCGLTLQNEFEVIALGQNTTLATSVPQTGLIAYFDGNPATDFNGNYVIPIPEGTPYGLHTYKNIVYYFAGGSWWALTSPTTQPVRQKQMPGTATEFSGAYSPIIMYPNAATVRRDIQMLAWPGSVPNTNIKFGTYSWGATNKNYPESLGYNYQISTGSQYYSASNNLKLGMAQSYGDLMHVSWRDDLNGGYGIDAITNSSNPAPVSYIKALRFDGGWVAKKKTAYYVEAYFVIPSGCTVTLAYSIDSGTLQTSPGYTSTTLWQGEKGYARWNIGTAGKFHNIDIMLTFTNDSTVTVAPILQALDLIWDSNLNELPQ